MSKWVVYQNFKNGKTGEMEKEKFLRMIKKPGFNVFGVIKEFNKKEDKAGFVPPESTVKKSETKVEDKKTT